MTNYMEGYKAFGKDMCSFDGTPFHVGESKHIDGEIDSGPINGHGFHFCENFEDTFRYTPKDEEQILCEVIGYGTISREYCDEYYGYFGIYASSDLYVKRIVPREEIMEMARSMSYERIYRLLLTYNFTEEEINILKQDDFNSYSKRIQKTINTFYNNK